MAKVQQRSEKITAFGGIFFVLDKFDSILSSEAGRLLKCYLSSFFIIFRFIQSVKVLKCQSVILLFFPYEKGKKNL